MGDLPLIYLKGRDDMSEEAKQEKPWYQSRKFRTAIATVLAIAGGSLLADHAGVELGWEVLFPVAFVVASLIVGVAVEDGRIIPAKILKEANEALAAQEKPEGK